MTQKLLTAHYSLLTANFYPLHLTGLLARRLAGHKKGDGQLKGTKGFPRTVNGYTVNGQQHHVTPSSPFKPYQAFR